MQMFNVLCCFAARRKKNNDFFVALHGAWVKTNLGEIALEGGGK
jgi:hypothetical protein